MVQKQRSNISVLSSTDFATIFPSVELRYNLLLQLTTLFSISTYLSVASSMSISSVRTVTCSSWQVTKPLNASLSKRIALLTSLTASGFSISLYILFTILVTCAILPLLVAFFARMFPKSVRQPGLLRVPYKSLSCLRGLRGCVCKNQSHDFCSKF